MRAGRPAGRIKAHWISFDMNDGHTVYYLLDKDGNIKREKGRCKIDHEHLRIDTSRVLRSASNPPFLDNEATVQPQINDDDNQIPNDVFEWLFTSDAQSKDPTISLSFSSFGEPVPLWDELGYEPLDEDSADNWFANLD